MRVIYAAAARIPSEKAHHYQIVQMCEAFAQAGAEVTLLYAARRNLPELQTDDIWTFYGVNRNFAAESLPCLDLYPLAGRLSGWLARLVDALATLVVMLTFHVALLWRLARERDAVIYSRSAVTLGLIALLWPRRARRAFFEAHTYPSTRGGRMLRRWLVKRIGGVVVITEHLKSLHADTLNADRILVAHDGIRRERFEIEGDRVYWRERLGWPQEAFIIGYSGRFIGGLESMDKGIDLLLEATIRLSSEPGPHPVRLALVGGPEFYIERVRAWLHEAGLPPDFLLYPGMVPPADVPRYLRAFDVCVIPSPWSDFFAYFTSPLKLFEYMASGSPLVASDLPSTAEIIRNGENGLLVPPGDAEALAAALRRLRDDPALAGRLAARAAQDVLNYTWDVRAQRILAFIQSVIAQGR